jgi:hypothetical protein
VHNRIAIFLVNILVMALFVALPLVSWPSYAAPKCIEALAKLKYKFIRNLPDKIPLPLNKTEIEAVARLGAERFAAVFVAEYIASRMGQMADQSTTEWSKRDIRALVDARKTGQIPRSLHRLLSADGEVPDSFDEFMRQFGKALDHVRHDEPHKAPEHAIIAIKALEIGALEQSLIDPVDLRLRYFKLNLKRTVDRITELTLAKRIRRRDYHELRKRVRDLKVLTSLMAEVSPSADAKAVALTFEDIDDRLGDTKDDLKEIEEEYGNRFDGELITRVADRDREVLIPLMKRIMRSLD